MCSLKINTERLLIRRIENKDKLNLFEIMSDRETASDDGFTPYQDMTEKYEVDFKYLLLDEMHYAIESKEYHKVIGIMHLTEKTKKAVMRYEIGYDINPAFRRKGYATEAVKAIIDYCFNVINIELMTASVYSWNIKSSNMLKKIGFIQKEKIYKAKHVRFGQVNMLSFYKKNNSIKKSKIEGNISQNTL